MRDRPREVSGTRRHGNEALSDPRLARA